MSITRNSPRKYEIESIQEYPQAAQAVWEGMALSIRSTGYVGPLVAGEPFAGFAVQDSDNSASAAGDRRCQVRRSGHVRLSVAGVSSLVANRGALVYASDDDTFTVAAAGGTLIGRIARWISSTLCIVDFNAFDVASPAAAQRTVAVAESRAVTAADDGATLECTATVTLTVPEGLPASFSCTVIPSGTTSVGRSGAALLNGAGTTLTRAAASNALFAIVARASAADSYVVTGS